MKRTVAALLGLGLIVVTTGVAFAQQPQPQPGSGPRPVQLQQLQAPPGVVVQQVLPPSAAPVVPGSAEAADVPAGPEQPAPGGKGSAVAFWIFAALAVGGAILTITRRNAVSAVMFLVATFFAIAAIYAMLFAHFMAAIQVLVYAGAIMVLFVFVIMILNKEEEEPWAMRGWFGKALAGGALVYFLVRVSYVLWSVKSTVIESTWRAGEFIEFGTTKAVGKQLFTSYLFPFEAVSIALLIAIVGAVVLAHPDHPTERPGPGEGKGEGAHS